MSEETKQEDKNKSEVKEEVDNQSEKQKEANAEIKKDQPEKPEGSSDKETREEPKKEVDPKFKDLVENIEKMSVLELSELVKALEDRFGVSAAAPVAVAAGAPGATDVAGDGAAGEKSNYTIMLSSAGDKKIEVIKAVREITGLGLAESKALVDGAPKVVKENVASEEAQEAKKKLEEAGASIELQ